MAARREKRGAPPDRLDQGRGAQQELRQWFNHDPAKWKEFQRRYRAELDGKPAAWQPLLDAAKSGDVTLLFSAHDLEHNNAAALKVCLEGKLKARSEG